MVHTEKGPREMKFECNVTFFSVQPRIEFKLQLIKFLLKRSDIMQTKLSTQIPTMSSETTVVQSKRKSYNDYKRRR